LTITDAVIPVGGLGTRLLPATKSQPKEMLPIVGAPVVQYVMEELARAGIERVLFVTGRRKRAIEDHFDADPELERAAGFGAWAASAGLRVLYTRQAAPRGLGDALRYADGFAGAGGVVVALGDAIVEGGQSGIVGRLIEAFERSGADAALAVEQVGEEEVSRYGVVATAPAGAATPDNGALDVTDVVEKPAPGEAPSRLAIAARFVLGPRVFAALRDTQADARGEVQLADALRLLLAAGGRVVAVPLEAGERRHDIGTVESYCRTFIEFALRDPQLGPALRAHTAALLDGER
jgi:UTP--glucose-1-phosphate uridylyltransferase